MAGDAQTLVHVHVFDTSEREGVESDLQFIAAVNKQHAIREIVDSTLELGDEESMAGQMEAGHLSPFKTHDFVEFLGTYPDALDDIKRLMQSGQAETFNVRMNDDRFHGEILPQLQEWAGVAA